MTGRPKHLNRTTLFEDALPVDFALTELEPDRLRRGFSELFDRAAMAVNRAGLDLDDVIVERFIACRTGSDREAVVRVDSLSDAQRLVAEVVDRADARMDPIRITTLRVSVIHERMM